MKNELSSLGKYCLSSGWINIGKMKTSACKIKIKIKILSLKDKDENLSLQNKDIDKDKDKNLSLQAASMVLQRGPAVGSQWNTWHMKVS